MLKINALQDGFNNIDNMSKKRMDIAVGVSYTKKNYDFYPTPVFVTEALLKVEEFHGKICEPCCGEGDISKVLISYGYSVDSSDIYNYGFGYKKDFLKRTRKALNIVTNPPFKIADKILLHALKITENKIALYLKIGFVQSQKRYDFIFKQNPPSRIYVFTNRINFATSKFGGMNITGWWIWDMKEETKNTTLEWIDCSKIKI